jgi:hypothetical protein
MRRYTVIIPSVAEFLPRKIDRAEARVLLQSWGAEEIEVHTANFARLFGAALGSWPVVARCPCCGSFIAGEWWEEFLPANLPLTQSTINTPCCERLLPISELCSESPVGYGRCAIEFFHRRGPRSIDPFRRAILEQALKCPIRVLRGDSF